jgi:hypothetical protein
MSDNRKPAKPDDFSSEKDLVISKDQINSVALARLVEEVRNDDPAVSRHYDRSYHRHNR